MTDDEKMAQLLDRYLQERDANPMAPPPPGPDPLIAETWSKLERHYAAPAPDAQFAESLRARLERNAVQFKSMHPRRSAQPKTPRGTGWLSLPRWSFVSASLLLVALALAFYWTTRPKSVDAAMLLDKAHSVATNLQSSNVKSFDLVQENVQSIFGTPNAAPTGESRWTQHIWYAGPTVFRIETQNSGTNQPSDTTIMVSDGASNYTYDVNAKTVQIDTASADYFSPPTASTLEMYQQESKRCFDPRVVGEEQIAGRAAYVIDLGNNKCPSASVGGLDGGPHKVWLDQETLFVLKEQVYTPNGNYLLNQSMVTLFRFNVDIPSDVFQFTPPAGTQINDFRAKPAPSADEFQAQLQELARLVDFPLFVPRSVPTGLAPRQPRWNGIENNAVLEYVKPAEASTNAPADLNGIRIIEQRATYDILHNWTDGTEPLDLDGVQAWVWRGDFNPVGGTGSNSALLLLRDGTLISVSSFVHKPDELIAIGRLLEPVPGGHPPLPDPTAPTLAEIRAVSNFPYFVPTNVPEGLTPEPSTSQELQYHRVDGSVALIVSNAKEGEGGMEQEARFQGELVKLSNGIEAHLLGFSEDVLILWWNKDGGYIALEGHGVARDEMLKIAASMSSTAELGKTEAPPARPTPTPVPAPSFTILRPTSLPEEMTTREEFVSGSPSGSGVQIFFDPHPGGDPHDVLTLTEMLQTPGATDIQDPQAVRRTVGGRTVTIVKRGEDCVSYFWTQGNVDLTLTNAYDPPGHVRYTCEQMDKIVESIK